MLILDNFAKPILVAMFLSSRELLCERAPTLPTLRSLYTQGRAFGAQSSNMNIFHRILGQKPFSHCSKVQKSISEQFFLKFHFISKNFVIFVYSDPFINETTAMLLVL